MKLKMLKFRRKLSKLLLRLPLKRLPRYLLKLPLSLPKFRQRLLLKCPRNLLQRLLKLPLKFLPSPLRHRQKLLLLRFPSPEPCLYSDPEQWNPAQRPW